MIFLYCLRIDNFRLKIFRMSKIKNLLYAKHFIILTYNERVYNEVGDESLDSGTFSRFTTSKKTFCALGRLFQFR